jgi:predicted permease
MTRLERLYRRLLSLYPARFRTEYGSDLEQALRDRSLEPRYSGWWGRVRLVVFVAGDLLRSLPVEHIRSRRRAGVAGAASRSRVADWLLDARYAVRGFASRPAFFVAAVLTLGLGVGASTTMFSVADGVVLRPLPYREPDRLVVIGTRYEPGEDIASSNPQDFFDLQRASATLEHVAASRLQMLTLLGSGEPLSVGAAGVSPSYFDVMGIRPSRGRAFTAADDWSGASPVAVLSWDLWQGRFGGDPSLIGRSLEFDGHRFTVVGIMPRSFHPPEAIHHEEVQLWFPLSFVSDDLEGRASGFLQAIGRLAPGVGIEAAASELERISASIGAQHPESEGRMWGLAPLHERTVGDIGPTLIVLLGAVGIVLLIACANVANLFLVRATERTREMAVRTALGARRSALVRLLLTESLVLAVVATAVAVLLTFAGVAAFRHTNPGDIPRLAEIGVDLRVLAAALATSISTAIVFAVVPALSAGDTRANESLREGATHLSASRRKSRIRGALVVGQTAVALILLTGAGLLIHSFANLQRVDPGFVPEGAVWMQVRIRGEAYPTVEARHTFFTSVLQRFRSIPGVQAAGGGENIPMRPNSSASRVSREGLELGPDERPPAVEYDRVTDGFFEALRTPVLRGRTFTAADDLGAEPVAVVNESLAASFWPDGDALGKRLKFGRPESEGSWLRVVGVVADLQQRGLGGGLEPQLYIPWRQAPRTGVAFIVRSGGDPAALLRAMKEQVWAVDPTLPIEASGTLEGLVANSVIEPRFYTLLLSTFAVLALVLAFVGLYGTIAWTVERRTREIGVRMAMGARPGDVARLMIGRGMLLAGAGLVLGFAGALASTHALSGFVFGITPRDPATLALTAATLGVAALLACWLPARRASRLDPARTLRTD